MVDKIRLRFEFEFVYLVGTCQGCLTVALHQRAVGCEPLAQSCSMTVEWPSCRSTGIDLSDAAN